jgi:hypothetical protein
LFYQSNYNNGKYICQETMTKSDKNAVYADNGVIPGVKRVRLADNRNGTLYQELNRANTTVVPGDGGRIREASKHLRDG